MNLRLIESICQYQALTVEKELADSQTEGLLKSGKESEESVDDIGSFVLQLNEERNQQFREYENLKLCFDGLETEKNLHFAWKQFRLAIVPGPFVALTACPPRIRLAANEHD
jgi:hypothetical protein